MLINFLKGFITCILLYSLCVNASNKCKELEGIAYNCVENEKGEIYNVGFSFSNNYSNKNIEKLFSYKTIGELYVRTEYNNGKLNQNIIDKIAGLSNLQLLDIDGQFNQNLNFEPLKKLEKLSNLSISGNDKKIEKHIIKYLKNLKELSISKAKLNKNDITDINSLSKLEYLNLIEVDFEKDLDYNFNIKKLIIDCCNIEKNFFKSLKNLKILNIDEKNNLEQYHIDEIATLSNLEEIYIDRVDKNLNLNVWKNLKNLKTCKLNDINGKYLKNVKDVKHLTLTRISNFSESVVKELGNISNLNELLIYFY